MRRSIRHLAATALFLTACSAERPSLNPASPTGDDTPPTASPSPTPPASPPVPEPPPGPGPIVGVLIGAGDIASCKSNNDEATARLLDRQDGVIFTTGDNVYEDGTQQEFRDCYGPTWGRHLVRTRPSPGNHEYHSPAAAPYYGYFGGNAGSSGPGYYSYDVAGWHILSLDSEIPAGTSSPQYLWVQNALASNKAPCAAAYWHRPLFSSGDNGGHSRMRAIWQLLAEHGVDVIIAGHDHDYERFSPQNADGGLDPVHGIRQFVVGTGGANLRPFKAIQPNSEIRDATTYGVLKLSLRTAGYDWEFLPAAGGSFSDAGTGICR